MDKILDFFKGLPAKFLEFWNKYTSKQKTIIISVLAAVIFTLVALIWLFNRTNYVTLATFESTADSAEARSYLEDSGKGFNYRVSDDALTISIDEKQLSEARLILGENGVSEIATEDHSFLFDNTFTTTDSERQLKAKIDLQNSIATDIRSMDDIKSVAVRINLPDNNRTLFEDDKEASASIMLTTKSDLEPESVEGIAEYVANALGNKNTDNIRIVDQTGQLLFEGGESATNSLNSNNKIRNEVISSIENNIRSLLVSSVYDDAQVMTNLDIQLDETVIEKTEYDTFQDGATGPKNSYYLYNAQNVDGTGGVVGTDANDEDIASYDLLDNPYGNSQIQVIRESYDTDKTVTTTRKAIGAVNPSNSSVSIVLTQYVEYDEELMKKQGLLDGISFEEFQAQNGETVQIDVDESIYNVVSNATGIKTNKITIIAYQVPLFYPKEKSSIQTSNILQIILAILIVALLIFVVLKGMRPAEVTELEPELSVEALLATTKENQSLEEIELNEKIATRQRIEKFVEENPEAVAQLLRNWLNDDDWE
ncbi:MAG: flagellar M-ring protein FliF [Lachnospiraceae bacterium]|nr:flagellar M-ring protein FliF [Lachnospiraceae bacterium]MBP3507232.1 flagellar M-ring protein FliF [Lachnospiraceae bacterium]